MNTGGWIGSTGDDDDDDDDTACLLWIVRSESDFLKLRYAPVFFSLLFWYPYLAIPSTETAGRMRRNGVDGGRSG
jgi:hypothetical protein